MDSTCKITSGHPCVYKIDLDGNGRADQVIVGSEGKETEVSVKLNGTREETVIYRSPPLAKEASLQSQWLSLIGADNGVGVKLQIVNFFRQVTGFRK